MNVKNIINSKANKKNKSHRLNNDDDGHMVLQSLSGK